ncbi:GNS1/SUR4 family-domain-containing protein [Trichophaea hybrida]|nr:GNS1/SUR4 family-domain-containing protein [Trichophaea hybrida]
MEEIVTSIKHSVREVVQESDDRGGGLFREKNKLPPLVFPLHNNLNSSLHISLPPPPILCKRTINHGVPLLPTPLPAPITLHPALAAGEPSLIIPQHVPIPSNIYSALLDVRVPLTIASVYAVSAHLANHYSTGKPYRIANTRAFKLFVVAHNVFLAVYSLWTFLGMVRGMHNALDKSSLQNVVGSLCKIRTETRGALMMGNGTTATVLDDVVEGAVKIEGLWEEALAWYGWWFYLSKFYEVVDTAVIILKGRKSSLLQTYHHAGAMICMWAGIRYMAPPIWIFCIFNSLIHALMYTYYTLSALHIRVPGMLKQSLTTLQITQFIIGGSFAALHLFVNLDKQTPCLSNDGEIFATITNCVYLAPLTYLFVAFFVESYTKKGKGGEKKRQ